MSDEVLELLDGRHGCQWNVAGERLRTKGRGNRKLVESAVLTSIELEYKGKLMLSRRLFFAVWGLFFFVQANVSGSFYCGLFRV